MTKPGTITCATVFMMRGGAMKLCVNWICLLAAGIFILAVAATALFGHRTYRSLQFLRSAYEVSAPRTSGIRGWMTLKYVSTAYRVSELSLSKGLELPPAPGPRHQQEPEIPCR